MKVTRNYPDQLMLRWLKKNRENGIVLTKEQIVEKAVQLLKTPGSWVKDKSRWFHVWASRSVIKKLYIYYFILSYPFPI